MLSNNSDSLGSDSKSCFDSYIIGQTGARICQIADIVIGVACSLRNFLVAATRSQDAAQIEFAVEEFAQITKVVDLVFTGRIMGAIINELGNCSISKLLSDYCKC